MQNRDIDRVAEYLRPSIDVEKRKRENLSPWNATVLIQLITYFLSKSDNISSFE